jgi:hypothetical protein
VMVSDANGRQWWRNFKTERSAELCVRGRRIAAVGEVLPPDSAEFRERAEQAFRRAAFIARVFDIDYDDTCGLTSEQSKKLGGYAAIVRFRELQQPAE